MLGVFPLDKIARVEINVIRCLKLFGCEIIFEVFQPICDHGTGIPERYRQTDGQTDRRHTVA